MDGIITFQVGLINRTAASFQAAPKTSNPRQGQNNFESSTNVEKRNRFLNISVPDTNSKFSPVLRENLRMVTKISFLPRFKVLTFLVWWFKLGLEVKIKQKNFFYFQTRLVQTCSNLLAERLSKKCSFPVTELKLCRILSEWDWIQTIERFSWAIRSCLPSFALWWIENWFREPKGYLNGSLCCFVRCTPASAQAGWLN